MSNPKIVRDASEPQPTTPGAAAGSPTAPTDGLPGSRRVVYGRGTRVWRCVRGPLLGASIALACTLGLARSYYREATSLRTEARDLKTDMEAWKRVNEQNNERLAHARRAGACSDP